MKLFKKIAIALLSVCVIGGSALAMTACGGGTEPTVSDSTVVVSTAPAASETGVADYLNRSDVQAELQNNISAVNESGNMRLRVSAEENSFVYTYTLIGATETLTADDFADTRLQLEASHSTFVTLINEIESETDAVNPNIVMRYENESGQVLYELTFTKTEVLETVSAA